MATEIPSDLATTRGVPNHDGVVEIERFEQRGQIVRIGVHLIAVPRLAGAPMTSPVVRNDAIALLPEEQHLAVPVVRGQWPAMRKHDRLPLSPVLVIDLCTVFGRNCCHQMFSFALIPLRTSSLPSF